jgi:hypothetical protein
VSNLGKPRKVELWRVGSKLVENTVEEHPYYWIIDEIKKDYIKVTAYDSNGEFTKFDEPFHIKSLTNLSLSETKVKNTELARFMYPEGKEDGEWLILEF